MTLRLELPPRPYIPPSACGAISALAMAAVALEDAWGAYGAGGALPWARTACMAFGCLAALGCTLFFAPERRAAVWLLAGLALSAGSSAVWMRGMEDAQVALAGQTASALSFAARGDPSVDERGAAVSALARGTDGSPVGAVRLNLNEPYEAGDVLRVIGRIDRLDEGDWGRSRFMRGEVAVVDAVKVTACDEGASAGPLQRARRAMLGMIGPDASEARALIAGIVCGRTTELNQTEAADAFSVTGLTHLVAVSGGHLALIATLLQGTLRGMGFAPAGRSVMLGAVMGAYVVFTGGAASAVRSLVMVLASMACVSGGRRGHSPSGLALAVMVLVGQNPGVVYDLGFQLSALSVLFIGVFFRYVGYLLERLRVPRGLAGPLGLTLVAQWATLPLTIPVFGQLSLLAPLANLVAGPLMSALLLAGLLTVPLGTFLPSFSPLMAIPVGLANASIWTAEALARIPCSCLAVDIDWVPMMLLYALAGVAYLLWRDWRPRTLAMALCLALLALGADAARWRWFAPAAVTVMDVGQADAILLREGPNAVLVDAGVDDEVVRALARQHVSHLDAVLITHWDADHWGGLPDILETMAVDAVYAAEGASDNASVEVREAWGEAIGELVHGDAVRIGSFSCRVVWPREAVAGDENEDSLCLDVEYRGGRRSLSLLLTGDTELEQEMEYAEEIGDVDVLKVGHHGSKVSVDAELLSLLQPEVAIASAGEGNRYGHPSQACIDAVERSGAIFLCTKDVGDVTIFPEEGHVRLTSESH